MTGRLLVVPNTLDFGVADGAAAIDELLPRGVIRIAAATTHWIVENARTARAFLKRVDAVVPLARPLQEIDVVELPRAARKTAAAGAAEAGFDAKVLLAPAIAGVDVGLLSEAGLPGLADPGAAVVAAAHALRIAVVVLPGASAVALAVAASGLDGQRFAFVGYLPVEAVARRASLRALEVESRREGVTQVAIETPYRNRALLDAMVAALQESTRLSVSVGLTTKAGWTRTQTIADWRRDGPAIPDDVPAVFAFGARR